MSNLNSLLKTGYWVLIIIPLLYLIVAAYSYFSVLQTFGETPLPHNVLEELAEKKELSIKIFPVNYGSLLIWTIFLSYLIFPFFILINYLLHRWKYVVFNRKLSAFLLIIYIAAFLLIRLEQFGWYMTYVLD